MSWLSKTAKKVEKTVSTVATKAGVGSDLKKAVNVFGAANVGGAVGVVTGFLAGGAPGAIYGAVTGGTVAAIGKYKGDSSSKYLSNAAGDALIAGSVGPLIYKPGATALITAPSTVSGYGNAAGQITVKSASGGLLGSVSSIGSSIKNVIADAVGYIGKGGITGLAANAINKIFQKGDPSNDPNPDYQQGNAVPPGGSFTQWLSSVLPGKSYDPTSPTSGGVSGGGGANPTTNVEVSPGGTSIGGSDSGLSLRNILIAGGVATGIYFLVKKGGLKYG